MHNAVLVLFVLSSFDALLTMVSIGSGIAYETNPLMATLYDKHPLVFFCGKQALMYGCCLLLLRTGDARPRITIVVSVGGCTLYTVVMAWHMYILGVT